MFLKKICIKIKIDIYIKKNNFLIMGINEDLRLFINKYKVEKGKSYTNTSIGFPKVSLCIPNEKYDDFINIYSLAMTNGVPLYFTEKPLEPSPLRVDIDFRFTIPDNKSGIYSSQNSNSSLNDKKKYDRVYTEENIFRIVDGYFNVINQYLDVSEEESIAYVMEKPNPVEFRNKLKDGLHIIFPNIIIPNNTQHFIRRKILDISADIFKDLPICNDYESIVDKAIIDVNCWQMYGSKKPDCDTYRVSCMYKNINNITVKTKYVLNANDELNFIKLFSMRKSCDNIRVFVKEDFIDEINQYSKHILPTIDQKLKSKVQNNIFGKSLNVNRAYVADDELSFIKRLVNECLSSTRADNYADWINLGWVLRNIDYRLLETWIEFSKISSVYIEGECQQIWDKMRKDNMGVGTLRWWAKQDNIISYANVVNTSTIILIDSAIGSDGSHFDIACVVHAIFKDEFKAISKDNWYKYDKQKHRWVRAREGLELRKMLSIDICKKFMERSNYYNEACDDCIQKALNEEKSKKCLKIATKLKDSNFKDSIMKECRTLFIDDKFEETLDSRKHLIGFDNGVYDLKMHMFRDGMPDDYILLSTKNNYVRYDSASIELGEINEFFEKIFTNKNLRNYVMDVLSCIIDGSITQERFYIFTGQGSNGKSRLLDLIQKSIGEYYCILPIALLTQKRAASNAAQSELERTKGRRFAVMQEPSENERLNIGLMKELSGQDRILVRTLYKEPYEFTPQFKMILTCNELPEVPSDDGGTWRRIKVCNFSSKFCENPDINKNEFYMDLELTDKFERWKEMFISMLIERHKMINPSCIIEPSEVRVATESYKQNNDIIGQFINENIIIDPQIREPRIAISKLYNDFRIWTSSNVVKGKKCPDRNQLKAYFEKLLSSPYDGKGWRGISYKKHDDDEDDE
jgi:P4 family phage/plasmid primase-like protien